MKRTLLFMAFAAFSYVAFAGGIVTNTNQSAAYTRILVRDASTGADAVYFNPAGLMRLNNGFHISLSSQTIWQDRSINNNYSFLNSPDYAGKVFAPVFPGVYATYKFDNFAISGGFNPIGGGGGAEFAKGLPSFEMGVSELVPKLQASGIPVTGYSADIYFKGQSVYYGAQLGVSANVTDEVSVFAGFRYVMANTSYTGHLRSITLLADQPIFGGETSIAASDFFTGVQAQYTAGAAQASAAAQNFATYPAAAVMPDAVATAAGLPIGTTFGQAAAAMTQAAATYTQKAVGAGMTSNVLKDQEADVTQKGTGITPIFGANFSLVDHKLNIGVKYELPTHLKVTNKTTKDVLVGYTPTGTPVTQFPDGESFNNDMPAMLSVGADYKFTPKFSATAGVHYYWDKASDYGKKNAYNQYIDNSTIIDKNYFEAGVGLEYHITDGFLLSAGFLRAQTGVSEAYQSDLSNSLTSNSVAFGGAVNITKKIQLNVGGLYTMYDNGTKSFIRTLGGNDPEPITVTETYGKGNIVLGVGLDFNFGKTE